MIYYNRIVNYNMSIAAILSNINGNPIYQIISVILLCILLYSIIKSLYNLLIITIFIIIIYLIYLDFNNDPDYEKVKNNTKDDIKETIPSYKEVKDVMNSNIPSLEEIKDSVVSKTPKSLKKIEEKLNK